MDAAKGKFILTAASVALYPSFSIPAIVVIETRKKRFVVGRICTCIISVGIKIFFTRKDAMAGTSTNIIHCYYTTRINNACKTRGIYPRVIRILTLPYGRGAFIGSDYNVSVAD